MLLKVAALAAGQTHRPMNAKLFLRLRFKFAHEGAHAWISRRVAPSLNVLRKFRGVVAKARAGLRMISRITLRACVCMFAVGKTCAVVNPSVIHHAASLLEARSAISASRIFSAGISGPLPMPGHGAAFLA